MNKTQQSPLFHISKRGALPWYKAWGIRGGAVLIALIVCGIITSLVTGENPFLVFAAIFEGSFGTTRKFWVLLQNIAMLLCVSLAVTPAFRIYGTSMTPTLKEGDVVLSVRTTNFDRGDLVAFYIVLGSIYFKFNDIIFAVSTTG